MGFTIAGPDVFLGGHPPLTEPGPPHLGLVRSTDWAQTWQPVSLRGQADYHALTAGRPAPTARHRRAGLKAVPGWN
jgi:hypothetical protein